MPTPISIGAPRPAPFFTPLFVAIDRGFLAEEGLEGRMAYRMGMDHLAGGDIDFASGGSIYGAYLADADLSMICGHATRETSHVLMVRPEIESAQGLEHVLLPGSGGPRGAWFVQELRNILAGNGVDLEESRIETAPVEGSHPEQWKMLQEGVADGATLGAPWWIFAARQGYHNLGGAADHTQSPTGAGIYVASERMKRDPEIIRAFVRAYVKAMRYCLENPEGAMETMVKYSAEWGVDDHEISKAVYDEISPYWRIQVDEPALRDMLRNTAEKAGARPRPLDSFLQFDFLNEALGAR